jgi:hypothetical protein
MFAAAAKHVSSNYSIAIFVLALGAIYVWVCFLIAKAAWRKGRSYMAWLAIAFFVSPVLAAILVASIDSTPAHGDAAQFVPCPRCAEPIRSAAVACRFCGMAFVGTQQSSYGPENSNPTYVPPEKHLGYVPGTSTCSNCSSTNISGVRFCTNCGAPVAPATPTGS